jgi:hypothetical protein
MILEDLNDEHIHDVYVTQTPTSTTISLSGSPGGVDNDMIRFSGCGYPGLKDTIHYTSPLPWLGNCAASPILISGAVGTVCNWVHSHGWRVFMHLINAQETVCEEPVFDSGGTTAIGDPTSYGLLIEGTADKIEIADGKFGSWNGIVNLPTDQGNGMGLVNINIAQSTTALANGPSGKIIASNLKDTDSDESVIWLDPAMTSFSAAGVGFGGSIYAFSDPAALTRQFCDRSTHLGSGECGQTIGTLACVAGCAPGAIVTGSDDRFDVPPSALTVTVQLAGLYDTAPVCTVSTSGPTGTATTNSVWISNVDAEPYWTQVTFKTFGPTAHIYGSCH